MAVWNQNNLTRKTGGNFEVCLLAKM